ncbi:zinc finger protein 225 [Bombyx mori]|uniref:C2H2-type domain-containing protein n=1 Tax=Bombyx mori TaxID=7091 RepID=A0A8R2M7H2_BOMMO|nr:zinc finger protein 225 [Bombyx mori]
MPRRKLKQDTSFVSERRTPTRLEDMSHTEKRDELYRLLCVAIDTSTIRPFRWFNNKFMCFYCCIPFVHSSKLKEHMAEEHADVKVTNAIRRVLNTARVKLDISDLSCKICAEGFSRFDLFLEHATDTHKLRLNREVGKCLFVFKLDDYVMSCCDCGESFRFFGSLLKHAHKFHNKDSVFLCETCGEGFVNKANLESHVRNVHHSNHKCTECEKVYKNHTALKNHIDKDHKNLFKCPKCPEVLGSRYLKLRHLALVHDEKMLQLKCDHCPQVFTTNRVLVQHTLRVHMKEKTVTCDLCGFKMFDKEALVRHMVRHDDSRPFECDVCKKSFQRKKTLTLHKRIHTNDRRYVCKVCGKAFVQATSLKLHMRVHHSSY